MFPFWYVCVCVCVCDHTSFVFWCASRCWRVVRAGGVNGRVREEVEELCHSNSLSPSAHLLPSFSLRLPSHPLPSQPCPPPSSPPPRSRLAPPPLPPPPRRASRWRPRRCEDERETDGGRAREWADAPHAPCPSATGPPPTRPTRPAAGDAWRLVCLWTCLRAGGRVGGGPGPIFALDFGRTPPTPTARARAPEPPPPPLSNDLPCKKQSTPTHRPPPAPPPHSASP